jgi:hypothetical protein
MDAKKALATGAAGMLLAVGGGVPALAASAGPVASGALEPAVGSVFSGTIEIASTDGLLVERRQRKSSATAPMLVSVDTDAQTVVSKGGQALSVEDLAKGAEVIVSGTKTEDGGLLASKIIIRN